MERFGLYLKRLRESHHLSQDQVAERVDVTVNSVSTWENVDSPEKIRGKNLQRLAAAFELTARDLVQGWEARQENSGVPLYNGVPASPPAFVGGEEQLVGRIPRQIPSFMGITSPSVYAVVVKGDSMAPTYHHGDVVLLDPEAVHRRDSGVESGRVYAIWFSSAHDEGATLKRVYVRRDGKWLMRADNPSIESFEVDPSDITKMDLVVGRIVPDANAAKM